MTWKIAHHIVATPLCAPRTCYLTCYLLYEGGRPFRPQNPPSFTIQRLTLPGGLIGEIYFGGAFLVLPIK